MQTKPFDSAKGIVVVDCGVAGASGDMFLGALLDLGANERKIVEDIKLLEDPAFGYRNVAVKLEKVMRGHFKATHVDTTAESTGKKTGAELVRIVEDLAEKTGMSGRAREFALKVIRTLVEAEAALHGDHLSEAHLHEVGLVDTPAEIVGCALAIDDLGLFDAKVYATPTAVGGGTLKFSHGTVPNPAPATLAILQSKNFPFKGGPVEAELTTPTGAAILVNLVDEANQFYPAMVPLKVGYGAGGKEFSGVPNVLRLTVGKSLEGAMLQDEIAVLETNLDDVTGEVIGYTVEKLFSEGAKDVSIIPMFTKKNRPGQIIKVIADPKDSAKLSAILIRETGTLGVRVYGCQRHVLNRETTTVAVSLDGFKQDVRVKVVRNHAGEPVNVKPEYEDLKALALKTDKPLREVSERAMAKAREFLRKK